MDTSMKAVASNTETTSTHVSTPTAVALPASAKLNSPCCLCVGVWGDHPGKQFVLFTNNVFAITPASHPMQVFYTTATISSHSCPERALLNRRWPLGCC